MNRTDQLLYWRPPLCPTSASLCPPSVTNDGEAPNLYGCMLDGALLLPALPRLHDAVVYLEAASHSGQKW